jgi:hypothetical protein
VYTPSNDGRLFMGQSTLEELPLPAADTFEEVALTGQIGLPAYTRETAFFNVTNDRNRRSLGGKLGDQTVEGNVVVDWDEQSHNDMFGDASADAAVKRNWYIDYADGRRLDFVGFISNWAEEPINADEEATESRANFTVSIDGAVTATPAVAVLARRQARTAKAQAQKKAA